MMGVRSVSAANGDAIVAGYFTDTADFGSGPLSSAGGYDIFIARYSAGNGACQWARRFGSTGNEYVQGVAVDGSGDIIVAGYFTGTADFGGGAGNQCW